MVDEHEQRDYRPAGSRDFTDAVSNVDAEDLRTRRNAERGLDMDRDRDLAPTRVSSAGYDRVGDDRPLSGGAGTRTYDARPYDADRTPPTPMDAERRTYDAPPAAVPTPPVADREYVDRPATTTTVRERVDRPAADRPFSIAAGFFGWAVASFFTLVLGTIVLALIGTAAYNATEAGTTGVTQDAFNDLTTGGLIGLLVALFIAYALGGYAAGRIGLWHGVGHGVAVVAWTVLFTIVTVALAAWLGDAVAGLNLVPAIDWNDLTGPAIAGILVSLLVMLAGAILGAKLGTRPYGIDDAYEGRRTRAWRGRPL